MSEKTPPPVSRHYDESVKCTAYNCDGWLVERHGKFGRFFGCTNFPRCRYTTDQADINSRLGLDDPDEPYFGM